MRTKYLLLFRAVLAETLLLQSFYTPGMTLSRWWLWSLLGIYAAAIAAFFFLERRRALAAPWMLASFILDIVMTSLILHATGGFSGDFYVAYFLVILSTCFIENMAFSFVVGGIACAVYAAMALPDFDESFQPFYLLRLSLLLATSFFSTFMADQARRVQRETAAGYEDKLAHMQRLSIIGQALTRILHELKTPLGTINLSAEYLRERLRQGQTAEMDSQLSVIEAAAERASDIVRDYMEFCKPSEIELQSLPVREPLEEALSSMRLRMEDSEVSLQADLSAAPAVKGSRRHLVQLFSILLDNALEAMPLGGRLRIDVTKTPPFAWIHIQDTGVGLPSDLLPRLFEPFVTSRPERGGTGLGLSIARWIVIRHGGDIFLESPGPTQGTTAIVSLPLA
ncbi:MAG: HAMP domain-containing sensor histidine kinase [Elusimicrobiota bacterium]|jgi:signal transduction histidine kinase